MKNKIVLILFLFLASLVLFNTFSKNDDFYLKQSNYINSLNISLKGKVVDIFELEYGHNCGLVTIHINESSIKNLDERKGRQRYLALIKNEMAYFALGTISDFELGDSIVVETNFYTLYRNKAKVISEKAITLPGNDLFNPYMEINEKLRDIR